MLDIVENTIAHKYMYAPESLECNFFTIKTDSHPWQILHDYVYFHKSSLIVTTPN